ncbi:MAG: hypothetical protein RLZZ123_1127 [Pseudomonadota bacterium]|jgi:hypothetical protein
MPILRFPAWFGVLLGAHFLAVLAHFSHNAEYLPFYPGMPGWLTREQVYLAWLAVTAVGTLALFLSWRKWLASALLGFAVYGALGLDGLFHYTLGLCADHTWVANLTIWAEALTGAGVLLATGFMSPRYLAGRLKAGRAS